MQTRNEPTQTRLTRREEILAQLVEAILEWDVANEPGVGVSLDTRRELDSTQAQDEAENEVSE